LHSLCTPSSHELGHLFSLNITPNELSLVPVVKEFSNVFEEVFGLPPKREIEFKIELEKDVRTIALSLRPIALRERWELEKQVAELLQTVGVFLNGEHQLCLPLRKMAH